jgi:hypothetical protein
MNRMAHLAGIGAILALPSLFVGPAQAANLVSFISPTGSDGNPCTAFAPCLSFAVALGNTERSGEIRCLDGFFQAEISISKPITFDCDAPGTGVTGAVGTLNAITINIDEATFPNAVVTLRNLVVDGFPEIEVVDPSLKGIRFIGGGAALHIENCKIFGFAQQGIEFVPTSSVDLFIRDTIVSNNAGGGILINPAASASVRASLSNVRLDRNGSFGLSVVKTAAGSVVATLDDVQVEKSTGAGIRSDGAAASVVLNDSVVTRNGTGITSLNNGKFFSLKNNVLVGNGGTNATPILVPLQ